jgi:hypothetical protein
MRRRGPDLNGAVEDAAEADAILEDAVDLEDGVVGLLGVAVGHVVHVEHHLPHLVGGQPPARPPSPATATERLG